MIQKTTTPEASQQTQFAEGISMWHSTAQRYLTHVLLCKAVCVLAALNMTNYHEREAQEVYSDLFLSRNAVFLTLF